MRQNSTKRHATMVMAGLVALATMLPATRAIAGGDWNDKEVAWRTYDEGLTAAKKEKKPVCLIFYTEWCPHCTNYSKVFHDAKIVERAKRFVMIRVDNDKNQELSKQYAPDGRYIPRTFFLSSSGALDPEIRERREQYRYFYSESDPASLLAGMDAALAKLH